MAPDKSTGDLNDTSIVNRTQNLLEESHFGMLQTHGNHTSRGAE